MRGNKLLISNDCPTFVSKQTRQTRFVTKQNSFVHLKEQAWLGLFKKIHWFSLFDCSCGTGYDFKDQIRMFIKKIPIVKPPVFITTAIFGFYKNL